MPIDFYLQELEPPINAKWRNALSAKMGKRAVKLETSKLNFQFCRSMCTVGCSSRCNKWLFARVLNIPARNYCRGVSDIDLSASEELKFFLFFELTSLLDICLTSVNIYCYGNIKAVLVK